MMSLQMARLRARLIAEIRRFFTGRSYLEVDTPLMAPALIPEPHIEVFETALRSPYEDQTATPAARYLVPSPEVWMKELLCEGFGNIYQVSHCFRNAESTGPQHSPEFAMLEWYTVDADYLSSAGLTDDLLGHLTGSLAEHVSDTTWLDRCRPPALRLSVAEAFEQYAGIPTAAFDSEEDLRAAAGRAGLTVRAPGEESYDDVFQRLFLTCVEEQLPVDRPVILYDYPAAVPTLAVGRPGSPFAERWELYLGGVEVANCYSEERDPTRLDSYLAQAGEAKKGALVPHPPADGFAAFRSAPRSSGVALGVDRLLMALTGARNIQEVIFSTSFGIFRSLK